MSVCPNKSRKPILVVNVDIADRSQVALEVFEGDSAEKVATEFCKFHRLSSRLAAQLTEHIRQNLCLVPARKGLAREDVPMSKNFENKLKRGASMASSTDLHDSKNSSARSQQVHVPSIEPVIEPRQDDMSHSPEISPYSDIDFTRNNLLENSFEEQHKNHIAVNNLNHSDQNRRSTSSTSVDFSVDVNANQIISPANNMKEETPTKSEEEYHHHLQQPLRPSTAISMPSQPVEEEHHVRNSFQTNLMRNNLITPLHKHLSHPYDDEPLSPNPIKTSNEVMVSNDTSNDFEHDENIEIDDEDEEDDNEDPAAIYARARRGTSSMLLASAAPSSASNIPSLQLNNLLQSNSNTQCVTILSNTPGMNNHHLGELDAKRRSRGNHPSAKRPSSSSCNSARRPLSSSLKQASSSSSSSSARNAKANLSIRNASSSSRQNNLALLHQSDNIIDRQAVKVFEEVDAYSNEPLPLSARGINPLLHHHHQQQQQQQQQFSQSANAIPEMLVLSARNALNFNGACAESQHNISATAQSINRSVNRNGNNHQVTVSARGGHAGERLYEWAHIVRSAKAERAEEIKKAEEEVQKKELTFKPQITEYAKSLSGRNQNFVMMLRNRNGMVENEAAVPVWMRDHESMRKMKQEKVKKMQEEIEKKKTSECTFKPEISKKSREILQNFQQNQQANFNQIIDTSFNCDLSDPFFNQQQQNQIQDHQQSLQRPVSASRNASRPVSSSSAYLQMNSALANKNNLNLDANVMADGVAPIFNPGSRTPLLMSGSLQQFNFNNNHHIAQNADVNQQHFNASDSVATLAAKALLSNGNNLDLKNKNGNTITDASPKAFTSQPATHFDILYSDALRRQQRMKLMSEMPPQEATFHPKISDFAKQQLCADGSNFSSCVAESIEKRCRRLCYDAIEERSKRLEEKKKDIERKELPFRPSIGRPPKPIRPLTPSSVNANHSQHSSNQQFSGRGGYAIFNTPRERESMVMTPPVTDRIVAHFNGGSVFDNLYFHALKRERELERLRLQSDQEDADSGILHIPEEVKQKSNAMVDQAVKRLIREVFVCLDLDSDGLLGGGALGVRGLPSVDTEGVVKANPSAFERGVCVDIEAGAGAKSGDERKRSDIGRVTKDEECDFDDERYCLTQALTTSNISNSSSDKNQSHSQKSSENLRKPTKSNSTSSSTSTLHLGCYGPDNVPTSFPCFHSSNNLNPPGNRLEVCGVGTEIEENPVSSQKEDQYTVLQSNECEQAENSEETHGEDEEHINTGVTIPSVFVPMVLPILQFVKCTGKAVTCEQFETAVRFQQRKLSIPLTDMLASNRQKSKRLENDIASLQQAQSAGRLNISQKSRQLAQIARSRSEHSGTSEATKTRANVFESLYRESEILKVRREQEEKKKEADEIQQCTFQPNIGKGSFPTSLNSLGRARFGGKQERMRFADEIWGAAVE